MDSETLTPEITEKDYAQIAADYAREVLRDKKNKRHGKLIQAAAQRFLDDLERARSNDCPFYFDPDLADHACAFIEEMPHVEGTWETETIQLIPAQVFFVAQLFGFRDASTGLRRFTSALFWVARKNAKSTLAAAIMIYCLCWEWEPGGELLNCARTYKQASEVFSIAQAMIKKQPDLRAEFGLDCLAKRTIRYDMGAHWEAVHSKAESLDGLNPWIAGLDEIHAHKDPDLVNVLRSAAGARRNPLWLYTTTEGYEKPGPWADLRLMAKQVLAGVFREEVDHFLVVAFAVDEDDDDFDEEAWYKANPLMEFNPQLLLENRKLATEAKMMPGNLSEFRIKRLNRSASNARGAIDLPKWKACSGEVDLEWLADYPCWAGLDLASTQDLTAFRLVWEIAGVYYTWGMRWCPEEAAKFRTAQGAVNYGAWIERGLLKQTPGARTDYGVVTADIKELGQRFDIQRVGYDPYNAGTVVSELEDAAFEMVAFPQTTAHYHGPIQLIDIAYGNKNLRHGGDPILAWCASNLFLRYDAGQRAAPNKTKSADKIDDYCALAMAVGVIEEPEDFSFATDPIIGS